ncbi:integrin beta-2 [Lampris incognitus]|uniref:integrin beta-2 n=1 Tax=Lampris incognitus TaxID=2546036 RepID=UPI0024B4942F|nr:integrin beta-2 [Lampris incognitus]
MDRCLLFLLLFLRGRSGFSSGEELCSKTVITTCGDCIRSGPYCVWCNQLNFTRPGEQEAARCDTKSQLMERGCKQEDIISPGNYFRVLKEVPLSTTFVQEQAKQREPVQLFPQKIELKLRPGLPTTFTLRFKRVQGYPVDLYYLMDLSYSMEDDLRNVRQLGSHLLTALKRITEHAQIGFGSFVDKTVLPFTNTNKEKLEKPCDAKELYCQPAFGYRHVLSMTADDNLFQREVSRQFISGNLDPPEGSFDAMMQAAVCGSQIGWRNSSTRLIVLTTDAGFHMAGDGKLAGILEPNDERCHLNNQLYAKSNEMDYPSVGQLTTQLQKNNIQPIFAVTKEVADVYKQLSTMIPKSEVGVLTSDSSNVVGLIESAYNRLSSKVTVAHDDVPDTVSVTYTPICKHGGPAGDTKGVCDKVGVGEEIAFNVTVTAEECMKDMSFIIRPLGIKDTLSVTLSTNCECECNDPPIENHPYCNGKGRVSCGMCSCNEGSVGQKCECAIGTRDESSLRASCRKDNGTECEGRGDCVCGRCSCHTTESGSSYHGDYCECDDEHCERFQNKLCAGNGRCRCGKCECKPGYEGSDCHCKTSDEQCRTPSGSVCSGRGKCECNQCKCKDGYRRPFCDICHGCPDPCQTKQQCIECLGFNTGPFKKNCTQSCGESVTHTMVDTFTMTKKPCKQKDEEGCWMIFKMEQLDGEDNYKAEILRTRECPELPNIYAIIGGSIAGVALIGLLILLLIKFLIHMNDLKELRKFENEKKKAKWENAPNPLYKDAVTTVNNPTFTGQ